ncbi:MAG: hypothetical protein R3C26_20935 [Calditrichia bacterium]
MFGKMYRKGLDIWLPGYLRQVFSKTSQINPDEPVHIMVSVVDHYEPGNGGVDIQTATDRVTAWVEKYPEMASHHSDADGVMPQHTFFYPPHYHEADHLERIVQLSQQGFGEVELHLHHNHHPPFPETDESLRQKIEATLDEYARFGIWGSENGNRKYGFIHGNWALDNSCGGEHCGVNNEIMILKESGCYADFTYPAPDRCQPRMINTIYYAKSVAFEPKSHDIGEPVECGKKPWGDLMIIQGPKGVRWRGRPFASLPCIESAEIDHTNLPTPRRIDHWVKTNIHVSGKPNWIFIKLHCHGAPEIDHDSLIGKAADEMFSHLENRYNDGKKYQLHYVTAREMYNIIKAAEASKTGSPNLYRDYLIQKPDYQPKNGALNGHTNYKIKMFETQNHLSDNTRND